MNRTTALVVALALAGASVLGLIAATKTTTLGASAHRASSTAIAQRAHKLDSFEIALKKALHSHPPALPKMPKVAAPASAPIAAAVGGGGGGGAQRIVYHHAAPIVVVKHLHHGDDGGGEHGDGGGGGGGESD